MTGRSSGATAYFSFASDSIAPRDHVSAYAAKHPQEDFAETFRFYVTRRGRLRARCRRCRDDREPIESGRRDHFRR